MVGKKADKKGELMNFNISRYKDFIKLLLKYGFSDLVFQSKMNESLDVDELDVEEKSPKSEEFPRDLEKLGPTFIKLGQFLSSFSDLLPPAYIQSLTRLYDQVEPFPYEEVEKIVSSDLGVKISKAFSAFDPKPFSAASLSQVHKAVLRNGREVAVKVQRPNIRQIILSDLTTIDYIANLLDNYSDLGTYYHFEQMASEFRTTIMRELDFRLESHNQKILGQNLTEFPSIVVPQPVEDYTGNRVLTMDYISGTKIEVVRPLPQSKINRSRLAEELFRAYLKQILLDGFFHADPHPGNVLLTHNGKLALLDIGMVAHVGDELQDALLKILIGISEGDGEKVVHEVLKIAETHSDFKENEFTHDITTLVSQQQHKDAQSFNMGKVVLDVSRISRKNSVSIPTVLSVLGKTLLNLDQVGSDLAPQFDPNQAIQRYASELVQQRMWKSFSPGNLFNSVMEIKEIISKFPQRLNRILSAFANNELVLRVESIDEKVLITGIQKIANRITIGLILAALIIGAALLMRVDTPFKIFGYPVLAIVFFLIAAIGGMGLIIKIIFTDEHPKK